MTNIVETVNRQGSLAQDSRAIIQAVNSQTLNRRSDSSAFFHSNLNPTRLIQPHTNFWQRKSFFVGLCFCFVFTFVECLTVEIS